MTRIPSSVIVIIAVLLAVLGGRAISAQDKYAVQVPDGLAFSEFRGYEAWQVVSISQDGDLIAAILANPVMIDAYLAGVPGNGKPFPDARWRGRSIDRKSGHGSEVGHRFPMSASGPIRKCQRAPQTSGYRGEADGRRTRSGPPGLTHLRHGEPIFAVMHNTALPHGCPREAGRVRRRALPAWE